MRLAVRLFDLTWALHGLPRQYRRALKVAAMLHDVGRCRGAKRHHIRGQRMILSTNTLKLDGFTRRLAAFGARHHRGRLPTIADERCTLLASDDRPAMRLLLAMLRTADALDKRTMDAPAIEMMLDGTLLTIDCSVCNKWRKAKRAFRRRSKFRMLSEELGLDVLVRVRRETQTV